MHNLENAIALIVTFPIWFTGIVVVLAIVIAVIAMALYTLIFVFALIISVPMAVVSAIAHAVNPCRPIRRIKPLQFGYSSRMDLMIVDDKTIAKNEPGKNISKTSNEA